MTNTTTETEPLRERESETSTGAPRADYQLSDFDIVQSVGEGSFSEVIQASLRTSGQPFALKIVDKRLSVRHKKVESLKLERRLLSRLNHPGIVQLHFTFQDNNSLYFGLELCPKGELFDQIQRQGKLSVSAAKFYAAEILQILTYLREQKVIHGDLKPENLLLTEDGHLKLIDFGSAFDLSSTAEGYREKMNTLQGTADYTAPEMLEGKPPFRAASEYLTFERILALDYEISDQVPEPAQDLIKCILKTDPSSRLGAKLLTEVQDHPFFLGEHKESKSTAQVISQ